MITIPSYLDAVSSRKAFAFVAGQVATAEDQNAIQQGVYTVLGDIQSNLVSEAALIRGELSGISTTLANEIVTLQDNVVSLSNNKASKASTLSGYGITDAINISKIGVVNGLCPLDSNAKVPSTYLPSYVDDILEAEDYASLPSTGETGKIYITIDNGKQYRWSGSGYVFLEAHAGTADAALILNTPRTISATGDIAWTTSFDGGSNVTGVATLANTGVTAGVYTKVNVDVKGRVVAAGSLSASDIPVLNQDTTGRAALATTADKATKLATPRKINDVDFDGTADIYFPVADKINSDEKVSSFVAESNSSYMINASGLTVTLPSNPVFGDRVTLYDITSSSSSLVVHANGNKVDGALSKAIEYSGFKLEIVFTSGIKGWVVFNCSVN